MKIIQHKPVTVYCGTCESWWTILLEHPKERPLINCCPFCTDDIDIRFEHEIGFPAHPIT